MGQTSRALLQSQIPAPIRDLISKLNATQVRWALLRPWEGLCADTGDVDILLRVADFANARKALRASGFTIIPFDGDDLHAAMFDRQSGRFHWIHVQSRMRFAEDTFQAEFLLGLVTRNVLPELPDDWLLWTILLRSIDRGCIKPHYRERLEELALDWGGGPDELTTIAKKRGLNPEAIVDATARGEWGKIVTRPASQSGIDNPGRIKRIATRAMRISRFIAKPSPYGLCVAVIGPDGAGKSTLLDGLQAQLPFRTRRSYMGLTGGLMRKLTRLRIPGLVFLLQTGLLWVRYVRGLLYRRAGQVVLYDRYVLDGAVPPGQKLPRRTLWARRAQRWLLPLPDITLLLDVPGATMFARKGEYSPEVLDEWRTIYLGMHGQVRGLVVLDASKSKDEVLHSALSVIWEEIRNRLEPSTKVRTDQTLATAS